MKLPAYPDYTDCALPWLERYPSHWSLTQTKRVCQFTTGWTPPTGDAASYDGDCPWANISDLRQRVIFDTAKTISEKAVLDHGLEVIPAGSLMFSFKLSVGHVAFAGRPMFSNEAIASFRESSGLSLAFAYYAFPIFLVENAAENIYGAKLLNQSLIRDAFFPLPPKEEQSAIAAFLDREVAKIDALIAEEERLLELLAEKRQGVIARAVAKGLNPDAPMKDSGVAWVGAVPAHWHLPPLSIRYESLLGKMLDSAKISGCSPVPYLRNIDVQWGRVNLEDLPLIDIDERDYERFTVRDGDLLVCEGGEVGRAALVSVGAARVGFQKALHRLRALSADEHPPYLFYTFNWAAKAGAFAGEGQATIAHLTGEQIRRYRFPTPPYLEQVEIAKYLSEVCSQFDTAAEQVRASLALLRERRSVLIANAVTGQIDVREAA